MSRLPLTPHGLPMGYPWATHELPMGPTHGGLTGYPSATHGRPMVYPWATHPRIANTSIHLQLQQTEDEAGGPPVRYRPARCRNRSLGFVESAPPGEHRSHLWIRSQYKHLQFQQTGDENVEPLARYRPARCEIPTRGSHSQRHLGRITLHPRIKNPS